MEEDRYAVTSQDKLRSLIEEFVPKDKWMNITTIYDIIKKNIREFQANDFDVLADYNSQPKWKRNIRNALQNLKSTNTTLWDGEGNYMFLSDISTEIEESSLPLKSGLSESQFFELLERKKEIGRLGEEFVVELEQNSLNEAGKPDLAMKVERISINNVGAGFDILSYDKNGVEKQIEVKTTVGSGYSFEITKNELKKSKQLSNYYIYFIREFNPADKDSLEPIVISGKDIDDQVELTASSFTASLTDVLKK